jgi:hypothetical protein
VTRPGTPGPPPHATARDLLVLHALRCIGFAGAARVSEAAGLPEPDVESELIDLAVAGLVTHVKGEFGGWGLTGPGRAADAKRIAAELDASGARRAVTEAFDDFLFLNPLMLDLCTAWQMRPSDGSHDSRMLDLLIGFDRRAEAVLDELSAVLLRFRRYRVRLTTALTLAKAGELHYVVDDLASYHTVWFQLHEDLLATLGLERT